MFDSIAFVWLANHDINYWLKSRVHRRKDAIRTLLFLESPMDSVFCFSKAKQSMTIQSFIPNSLNYFAILKVFALWHLYSRYSMYLVAGGGHFERKK